MATRTIGSQVRDLLAYVGIAAIFVAGAILAGVYTADWGKQATAVALNWLCLAGVMAIVFISAIHEHRPVWRRMRFWSGWTVALLTEAALGALVLWSAPKINVWFWAVLYPINAGVVEAFLTWWLRTETSVGSVRAAQQSDEADEP